MGDLVLPSIHIRGYKAFRDFRLEKLGRVNLITGRNGTGKTAFLEAVEIYARRGDEPVLWSAADASGFREALRNKKESSGVPIESKVFRNLFHDLNSKNSKLEFSIGPVLEESKELTVRLGWLSKSWEDDSDSYETHWHPEPPFLSRDRRPAIEVSTYRKTHAFQDLSVISDKNMPGPTFFDDQVECVRVPLDGFDTSTVREFWDGILLTDYEEFVHDALRYINPEIQRLAFVGPDDQYDSPRPIVKLKGIAGPVPLETMGEGVNRLLGLACSLVNCANGVLLVDEIETGLHYSVQREMWHLIFETARRLNIQVFVTTHSADCAKEFSIVAGDFEDDGMLFRLFRSEDGDIKSRGRNREDLLAVLEFGAEVR